MVIHVCNGSRKCLLKLCHLLSVFIKARFMCVRIHEYVCKGVWLYVYMNVYTFMLVLDYKCELRIYR